MNKHTDDEGRWSLAEIEAACDDAHVSNIMQIRSFLMTRRNKPVVHPDIPVLCDVEGALDMLMKAGRAKMDPRTINVRVLISAEMVIKKAKARDEYLKEFGGYRVHSDETYWATVIADYTKNGPGLEEGRAGEVAGAEVQLSGKDVPAGICRVCGCTDETPCIDPATGETCSWAEPNLCSACVANMVVDSTEEVDHEVVDD